MRAYSMTLVVKRVNFAVCKARYLWGYLFSTTPWKRISVSGCTMLYGLRREWGYIEGRRAELLNWEMPLIFYVREIAHDMDHSFHRLCRRIWWVIFVSVLPIYIFFGRTDSPSSQGIFYCLPVGLKIFEYSTRVILIFHSCKKVTAMNQKCQINSSIYLSQYRVSRNYM